MEISKSVSFITEDPRWQQKLMIGTGVVIASTLFSSILIGIVGFMIIAGYSVRLLQNVRDGQTYPLPEWDQWGDDLVRGFKFMVATIVWAIPLIFFLIPTLIGIILASNDSAGSGSILLSCGGCFALISWIFLTVALPGVSVAYAKDEKITSGLQFREIIAWTQANIGAVLTATIVYLAVSVALSIIGWIGGLLLCGVGIFVTLPLATLLTSLFQHHMYGQLAYTYPYPGDGGSGYSGGSTPTDASLMAYTPPTDMSPGLTPVPPAPPAIPPVGTDTPVGDTSDYPDSGVDNPAPPPAI